MTEGQRRLAVGSLALLQRVYGIDMRKLPDAWEQVCQTAFLDPDLGELWLERQKAAIEDVRDWLARLEGGDDA